MFTKLNKGVTRILGIIVVLVLAVLLQVQTPTVSAEIFSSEDLHGSCAYPVQDWHNPEYVEICVPATENFVVTFTPTATVIATEISPVIYTQEPEQSSTQIPATNAPTLPAQEATQEPAQEPAAEVTAKPMLPVQTVQPKPLLDAEKNSTKANDGSTGGNKNTK